MTNASVCHHPDLAPLLDDPLDAARVGRIVSLLEEWGTLEIPLLDTGLVSAVHGAGLNEESGYDAVWLRDTVHVAHAFRRTGRIDAARTILDAILRFQVTTVARFDDVIAGRVDPADPQVRPHVRFDGHALVEIDMPWAHAQNDALGYVAWLAGTMARAGEWTPSDAQRDLLARFPAYMDAIDYANDRDSGHWEEERRRNASSVGTVVAGLEALAVAPFALHGWDADRLRALARRGRAVLDAGLPLESPPERRADAATLFLIEPLRVIDGAAAQRVIARIETDLMGPYGIRRYRGDSYWCADYRELLSADRRSTDHSHSTAERDRLLKPGTEAQWCIFDPVLTVVHARAFASTGAAAARAKADLHLRRALGQITGPDEWCGPGKCPEAWFVASSADGIFRANDQTPLAWTQAGLAWALEEFGRVV